MCLFIISETKNRIFAFYSEQSRVLSDFAFSANVYSEKNALFAVFFLTPLSRCDKICNIIEKRRTFL